MSLIYIARDIDRAISKPLAEDGDYFVVTNKTSFWADYHNHKNVLFVDGDKKLDTHELLSHDTVKEWINEKENPELIVFKNTTRIERVCKEHDWTLLNPIAELAARVEEKISQLEWLGELTSLLPQHEMILGKELVWAGESFIIQYNRAHTGEGTLFVDSEEKVSELKETFPERPMRKTDFVDGEMFTVNAVAAGDKTLLGNISYQITGLAPFTDNPFATVGNDWGFAAQTLSDEQKSVIADMATKIGEKLRTDGWKGLFGIDVIRDKQGNIFLIEINARQPASTTFESYLQFVQDKEGISAFDAHLAALQGNDVAGELVSITNGAQLVLRKQDGMDSDVTTIAQELKKQFHVVGYSNERTGSDLVRVYSMNAVMAAHGKLNDIGENIATVCKTHS